MTSLTMKGPLAFVFVLSLAASASSSNSDPNKAPAICAAKGSDGILVAHKDCDKFFKCSEGLPVALNCPAGLLWNANLEICDWPENVNCASKDKDIEIDSAEGVTSEPEGITDSSEAAKICSAEGSDGILVAHQDCDKFYKCSEGKPVALSCPSGLLWNANLKICDWPENVNCASKDKDIEIDSAEGVTSEPEGITDSSEAAKVCSAEGSDGILVAHQDCNKFYKCSEGKPVTLSCPSGLLWNAGQDICDWPANVNCKANSKGHLQASELDRCGCGDRTSDLDRCGCGDRASELNRCGCGDRTSELDRCGCGDRASELNRCGCGDRTSELDRCGCGDRTSEQVQCGCGDRTSEQVQCGCGDRTSELDRCGCGDRASELNRCGCGDRTSELDRCGCGDRTSEQVRCGCGDRTSELNRCGCGDRTSEQVQCGCGDRTSELDRCGCGDRASELNRCGCGDRTSELDRCGCGDRTSEQVRCGCGDRTSEQVRCGCGDRT